MNEHAHEEAALLSYSRSNILLLTLNPFILLCNELITWLSQARSGKLRKEEASCFVCSTSSVSAPCHASGCPCDRQRLTWCWPFLTLELIPSPTSLIPPTVMARKCLAAYRGLEFNWQFMVLHQVNKCYERVGVFSIKAVVLPVSAQMPLWEWHYPATC